MIVHPDLAENKIQSTVFLSHMCDIIREMNCFP